jgi:hypothetical protein
VASQSPPLPHPEHNTDTHKKDNNMKIKSSLYLFENQNQFMTGYCIRVQIRIVFFLSSSFSACVVTINQCTTHREREREKSGEGDEIYVVVVVVVVRGERLKLNDS